MKIKEAIEIISSTKTVRASLEKEKIYFYLSLKLDKFLEKDIFYPLDLVKLLERI